MSDTEFSTTQLNGSNAISDQTTTLQSSKSLFHTTTDFETTSGSFFTDITSSGLTDDITDKSQNITKGLLIKKQLLHDIQKLKIELSQKDLQIDTLKAEHLNRIDEFEDKLSDASHEKQLLCAKYETQLQMLRESSEKQIRKLNAELRAVIESNKKLEGKCEVLSTQVVDVKTSFDSEILTEEDYNLLKHKSEDVMGVKETFALKLYEHGRPLQLQVESLLQRAQLLSTDLREKEDELIQEKQDHEKERLGRVENELRCQKLQVQVEDLRSQLSHRSYKNQNFDNIQSERDALDRKIVDLEKQCNAYKSEMDGKSNQMEQIRANLLGNSQTIALLKQDKEYLSDKLHEMIPRYKVLEERFDQVSKQLDDVKHSREELYEKYLNSRDHYKREYEEQMKKELEEMSMKTNLELQRLKDVSKDTYERENRSLREAKENAIIEQERLSQSERQLQQKYNELMADYRLLQISSNNEMSEKQSEYQQKSFELERLQMMHDEALRNCKQLSSNIHVLSKKNETLNHEYYTLKSTSDRQVTELEGRKQELQSKLTIYEKLEQELDDVVMQAAELGEEADGERVLFAYGYGANVPSTAKRRMQQSVQLARRVLQLERTNTSLRHQCDASSSKLHDVIEEANRTKALLTEAQQPYNYLIESVRSRDEQQSMLKKTITSLEDDLRRVNGEKKQLSESCDRMSADLERLLNQREEMSVLKEVVANLQSPRNPLKKSEVERSHTALVFTKETPLWYQKLKRQNELKR